MIAPMVEVNITRSPKKLARLFWINTLMLVLGAWLVSDFAPDIRNAEFLGWVSILLFGATEICIVRFFIRRRDVIVSITRAGIRDIRISPDVIPWSAIEDISIVRAQRTKSLVLKLDVHWTEKMTRTPVQKLRRLFGRAAGIDGVTINSGTLKIEFMALFGFVGSYWHKYTGRIMSIPQGGPAPEGRN